MTLALICLVLLMTGLCAYAVLGGADFGGGIWDLTAGGDRRGGPVRGMVQRSMSPVWEANHVWLIFVLVVLWTAFPVAFGSIFSTLYVPLTLAVGGIVLRGAAFALRGQAATLGEARGLGALFASSSLVVPFCLGTVAGGVASGRVPVGNATGAVWDSWLNPTSVTVGVLAVVTGAYLAAVFMAGDAVRAGLAELERAFRTRALGAGVLAGAIALGALPVIAADAPGLYDGLTAGGGLACLLGSAALGVATLGLVWARGYEPARLTAAAAVALVVAGWAVAQSPDMLPGALTVERAAAGDGTLVAFLVSFAIAAVVLVPALVYLYRLVLSGTLDQAHEPLDRRYTTAPERDR